MFTANKLLYHVQQAGTARRFLEPREHWDIGVFFFYTLQEEHESAHAFLSIGLFFYFFGIKIYLFFSSLACYGLSHCDASFWT